MSKRAAPTCCSSLSLACLTRFEPQKAQVKQYYVRDCVWNAYLSRNTPMRGCAQILASGWDCVLFRRVRSCTYRDREFVRSARPHRKQILCFCLRMQYSLNHIERSIIALPSRSLCAWTKKQKAIRTRQTLGAYGAWCRVPKMDGRLLWLRRVPWVIHIEK